MPRRSAGLLLYRRRGGGIEVLLVHPGGPFWAKKNEGAWSIPKGEYTEGEDPLSVAKREFAEETGADMEAFTEGEAVALGAFRQSSVKTVDVWAVEGVFDPAGLKSNTFSMEWPPRSGRMMDVPEVDRAEWFTPEEAARKLLKGQRPVLESLLERLGVPSVRRNEPPRRGELRQQPMKRAAKTPARPGRELPKTSATYRLFRRAIREEKQVTCMYHGAHRELCPHIIGHSNGDEKVLAFQFAGETSKGRLPPGGQWKCLYLAEVGNARVRAGPWHAGGRHSRTQTCVVDIDLDINVHVRNLRRGSG